MPPMPPPAGGAWTWASAISATASMTRPPRIWRRLAKGWATKDPPDARLLLGIAQFKGGSKDEAVKTFRQVKGDPTLERLAKLWVVTRGRSSACGAPRRSELTTSS